MSALARAAQPRIRQEGRPPELKLAAIALAIACLLVGCESSTPPPAPPRSPAAQVDASAPASSVQAPPSSGDPAPSASAAPQPTPTPDPEAVREAAAAAFHAAGAANLEAFRAVPFDQHHLAQTEREIAETWDLYIAALKQLEVPDDTAANLRDLIRKVRRVQAGDREASAAVVGYKKEEPVPKRGGLLDDTVRTARANDG